MPAAASTSGERPQISAQLGRLLERHAHARAVLLPALCEGGAPSHAYLLHGPAGTGKRAAAREFAAELLAEGSPERDAVIARARNGSHPDLTWVTPSGAADVLVADIEQPVVAAATRTPFEASRRVFVIESVDRMNEDAANRMLKTLEEPASFVHLILLTDRRADVLATIASRCQQVRFDPLSPELIAAGLQGVPAERALACARLSLGDAGVALRLASEEGQEIRAAARLLVRAALGGDTAGRPWAAVLDLAKQAAEAQALEARRLVELELPMIPAKEQSRYRREAEESSKRAERRARTGTIELALRVLELWLRDVLCVSEGAPELIHAVDFAAEITGDAAGRGSAQLREAIESVADTRLSLRVNVAEDLALAALAYRLQSLLAV